MSDERTSHATWVSYDLTGGVSGTHSQYQVDGRNPQRELKNAPADAFAFMYFDLHTTEGVSGGKPYRTDFVPHNASKIYFIDATVLNEEGIVALNSPFQDALLENMSPDRPVLRTRTGDFRAFSPECYVLLSTG